MFASLWSLSITINMANTAESQNSLTAGNKLRETTDNKSEIGGGPRATGKAVLGRSYNITIL